ncbi:MAG: hypothetical protein NWF01_06790 [Candidatus Bathyarchaeota archaeon]|nr:hypothetical protein [Candidatus Bathyarchaeota archaeon]
MHKSVSCMCILALILSCLPIVLVASAADNIQPLAVSTNSQNNVLGMSLPDFIGVTIVVVAMVILIGIIVLHKQ